MNIKCRITTTGSNDKGGEEEYSVQQTERAGKRSRRGERGDPIFRV